MSLIIVLYSTLLLYSTVLYSTRLWVCLPVCAWTRVPVRPGPAAHRNSEMRPQHPSHNNFFPPYGPYTMLPTLNFVPFLYVAQREEPKEPPLPPHENLP